MTLEMKNTKGKIKTLPECLASRMDCVGNRKTERQGREIGLLSKGH